MHPSIQQHARAPPVAVVRIPVSRVMRPARAPASFLLTTMGITIHYYTDVAHPLDPAKARDQYEKAVALTRMVGRRLGWAFRGRVRRTAHPYTAFAKDGTSTDGVGTVHAALWDPDPGSETFALEWVEETGILPYCFVKTQYALNRVRVHAAIVTLLDRLNRLVFDGRLVVSDEGHFAETRSVDQLAARFGENEAVIRSMLNALRSQGWSVASPLDEQPDGDTSSPATS